MTHSRSDDEEFWGYSLPSTRLASPFREIDSYGHADWGRLELEAGLFGVKGTATYKLHEARIVEEERGEKADDRFTEDKSLNRITVRQKHSEGMKRIASGPSDKSAPVEVTAPVKKQKVMEKGAVRSVPVPVLRPLPPPPAAFAPSPIVTTVPVRSTRNKAATKKSMRPPQPRLDPVPVASRIVAPAQQIKSKSSSTRRLALVVEPTMVLDSDSDVEIIEDTLPSDSVGAAPAPVIQSAANGRELKKGRALKQVSMEEELKKDLTEQKLSQTFPTIKSYIRHLSLFEFAGERLSLLAGCRIIVVNKRRGAVEINAEGNRMSKQVRRQIASILVQGATIISPEDFIAPPPGADLTDETAAREGNWTTHIIAHGPDSPDGFPIERPYSSIFHLLGLDGIEQRGLGGYVRVVSYQWVRASISRGIRLGETLFRLEGDPNRDEPIARKPFGGESFIEPRMRFDADSQGSRSLVNRMGVFPSESGDVLHDNPTVSVSDVAEQSKPSNILPRSSIIPLPVASSSNQHLDVPSNITRTENVLLDPPSKPLLDLGQYRTKDYSNFDQLMNKVQNYVNECDGDRHAYAHAGREHDEDDNDVYQMVFTGALLENDNDTDDEEQGNPTLGQRRASKLERGPKKVLKYVCQSDNNGGRDGPNKELGDQIAALARYVPAGDIHRTSSYRKAAGMIRNYPKPITDAATARKLWGIGEKMTNKIIEILSTGTHRRHASDRVKDTTVNLFAGVYGVGKTTAIKWYDQGLRSLDDLQQLKILTPAQLLGLKYYDDLQERIPREEVTKLYGYVARAGRKVDPLLQIECMGSYRREQADCGDIDILVSRETADGLDHVGAIEKMCTFLRNAGILRHELAISDDRTALDFKVNGLIQLPGGKMRRIDILGVPEDQLPAAMIYFTGNDIFNRSLRLKARHMGYSLNQRYLSQGVTRQKDGTKIYDGMPVPGIKTEQDIFDRLEVAWRHPTMRRP